MLCFYWAITAIRSYHIVNSAWSMILEDCLNLDRAFPPIPHISSSRISKCPYISIHITYVGLSTYHFPTYHFRKFSSIIHMPSYELFQLPQCAASLAITKLVSSHIDNWLLWLPRRQQLGCHRLHIPEAHTFLSTLLSLLKELTEHHHYWFCNDNTGRNWN